MIMAYFQKTVDYRTDPGYGYDNQDDGSDYWRYSNRVRDFKIPAIAFDGLNKCAVGIVGL